jgi:hypothetical protein
MANSKSTRLRLSDVRQLLRLVGECRDLGDDARRWRTHLVAGLARLTGAGVGVSAEMGDCVRGPRRDLGAADWGWENGFDKPAWLRMLVEFHSDPLSHLLINAYIEQLPGANGACLSRADLIPDRDWYRSPYYQVLHRAMGADATLTCFQPVPGMTDEYSEVFLARARGERDFSGRDKVIVEEAHAAIAPLVGGALARFTDPSPGDLSPRTRLVLACLLEGLRQADCQAPRAERIHRERAHESDLPALRGAESGRVAGPLGPPRVRKPRTVDRPEIDPESFNGKERR